MATKSGIIAYITARWGDITSPTRVPLLDREVSNKIVDEIYPNSVSDSNITETYTTSSTLMNYNITIHKSGNVAHISGSVQNPNHFLMSNPIVFVWKNSEFKPNTSTSLFFLGVDNSKQPKVIGLNNSILTIQDSLDALGTVYFDFKTYITQD